MRVICIDGKPKLSTLFLPEGVPLEVEQSSTFPDSYRVFGYDYDVICGMSVNVYWRKRRFIPLSNIDEAELMQERQENETLTQ